MLRGARGCWGQEEEGWPPPFGVTAPPSGEAAASTAHAMHWGVLWGPRNAGVWRVKGPRARGGALRFLRVVGILWGSGVWRNHQQPKWGRAAPPSSMIPFSGCLVSTQSLPQNRVFEYRPFGAHPTWRSAHQRDPKPEPPKTLSVTVAVTLTLIKTAY